MTTYTIEGILCRWFIAMPYSSGAVRRASSRSRPPAAGSIALQHSRQRCISTKGNCWPSRSHARRGCRDPGPAPGRPPAPRPMKSAACSIDCYGFSRTPVGQIADAVLGQVDGDKRRTCASRASDQRGGKAPDKNDPRTGNVYTPSGSVVTCTGGSQAFHTVALGDAETALNSGAPSGETLETGGPPLTLYP